MGRLDILINNGATNPHFGPAHSATEEAYDKTFAVNTRGPVLPDVQGLSDAEG